MCFANRVYCKQCRTEKIKYVSECDQFPEVRTETPTHAIRGRHRRLIACKDCKRRNRQSDEEAAQRNVQNYPRAKAILEWMRLERPLPLTDEDIALRYADLFINCKRLHPYCVGFTNIHTELIKTHREHLLLRAKKVVEACMELTQEMSDEVESAVMVIVHEDKMFDEALKRQAEIDSGDRTMTESDRGFSLHEVGTTENFACAMKMIAREKERQNPSFANWTRAVNDRFITEDRFRGEINEFISMLEETGVSDDTIDEFRGQVTHRLTLDEMTFDFDPNARTFQDDTPAWVIPNSPARITFQQWVTEYENQLNHPIRPNFTRWYQLLDAYRAYLAQIAPAQYTLFNFTRNTIAASAFRALTDRPEPVMIGASEPNLEEPPYIDLNSEEPELADFEIIYQVDEERRRIQETIDLLHGLLDDSWEVVRNLQAPFNSASPFIVPSILFLEQKLDDNTFPTEADWTVIDTRTTQATEVIMHLESELHSRDGGESDEDESTIVVGSPSEQSEPEPEQLPFFIDVTPVDFSDLEQEPDIAANPYRHIIGLPPPEEHGWRDELMMLWDGGDGEGAWVGEMYEGYDENSL